MCACMSRARGRARRMPRGLPAYNVVQVGADVAELIVANNRVSTVRAVRARRTLAGGPVNSGGTSRGYHIICGYGPSHEAFGRRAGSTCREKQATRTRRSRPCGETRHGRPRTEVRNDRGLPAGMPVRHGRMELHAVGSTASERTVLSGVRGGRPGGRVGGGGRSGEPLVTVRPGA